MKLKKCAKKHFKNSGPTLTSTDASLSEARVLSSLFAWKLEAWTMWTHVDPRFLTRCPFRVQQALSEAVGKWQTSKADATSQENDLLKLIKINKFNDWYLTKLCLFYRQSRRLKSGETELPCASGSALLSPRRHGGSFFTNIKNETRYMTWEKNPRKKSSSSSLHFQVADQTCLARSLLQSHTYSALTTQNANIVHSLRSPSTQHSTVLFWHAWLDCKPTATGWWLDWSSMEWCWWNHQNST